MEKVLITGGAGFIGSNLARELSEEYEIYIVDDFSMGNIENLSGIPNLFLEKASVIDKKIMRRILTKNQFTYIFHLAAIASVADSVERPLETHLVNFQSVLNLLELVREKQTKLKRLVFSSSAAVYGDEPTLPKSEESVIRPLTPYAIDKFAAEKYVLAYSNLYGVPTSAVRFFNVYGPKQNPNSPYSGVISILLDRCQRRVKGEEINFTIFGTGNQSRDFVYVSDVVSALKVVSESNDSVGEVYNIGTGKATSLNELVKFISTITNSNIPIEYKEAREGDIPDSIADITKLRELGYKGKYDVEKGLTEYIGSYGKKS